MSRKTPPAATPLPRSGFRNGLRNFWQRVSEGRQADELWSQFSAEARASYGLYSREVDWDDIQQSSRWRRPFHIARELFLAMLMKLSPARRILLLVALVMMLLSSFTFRYHDAAIFSIKSEFFAAILLFLLLALELADRVTMKRDLEIAREIQNWLVPSSAPEVPGAEIAFAARAQNTVAGDYYDAFYPGAGAGDGGKLLLVIADVAGKSVPAALLMATFQASLRTIAGEGTSIKEIVARLNRYASAHSLDGRRFTTAVLAEYDPATRMLVYVNAGHNAPVLRRAGGDLEFLTEGGLPLGIEASAIYQTATVSLQSGDTLVLYTDGVVEAFNQAGSDFGEERWREAIRAMPSGNTQDMVSHLMLRLDEFVGTTRQSDDITCLVLRLL